MSGTPSKTTVAVAGRLLSFNDLGSPLTDDFLELYSAHYTHGVFVAADIFNHSHSFFDANHQNAVAISAYFENYTIIWNDFMDQGRYSEAIKVIAGHSLIIAWGWERRSKKKLHKGSPYYFLGVTKIAMDALDEGFLAMHQALEEDRRTFRTRRPQTPAYSFVTLDFANQNIFFKERVRQASDFLDKRLNEYRAKRGGSLTLAEFKKRFLESEALEEPVFYFVLLLHKLMGLTIIENEFKDNALASLDETGLLFSLDLVVDAVLRNKDPDDRHKLFRQFLVFLTQSVKPTLNILDGDLQRVSRDFETDFGTTLQALMGSRYSVPSGVTLSPIEEDLAIAHGFRNFGAHRIEYEPLIIQNFDDILQRIFNLLFFAIERIYP